MEGANLRKGLNGLAPTYQLHDFHYARDFHAYNTQNKDLLRFLLGGLRNTKVRINMVIGQTTISTQMIT